MDIPDNPRDITEPQRCPRCEYTWDVLGLHEHGNWNPYNEDDLICEGCGKNLMEEDEMTEIILKIDGDRRRVSLDNYVKAKMLSLREFGYADLSFEDVMEQAQKVLDGHDLSVIGMFMENEIEAVSP